MFAVSKDPGDSIAQMVGFDPKRSSTDSGWRNVALYEWNGIIPDCDVRFGGVPLLALHLSGGPLAVSIDGRWARERSYPGLLTFVPPSQSAAYRLSGKVRSLTVHLGPSCFDSEEDVSVSKSIKSGLQFKCAFRDDFLSAGIRGLADEMTNPSQIGPLYADSLGASLAMHMLRKSAAGDRGQTPQIMSRRALRIALDMIDASIETGTSLESLAREVGLSRTYFAKAFKQSTGLAPHSYLTNKRIERARHLLSTTDETISQIAVSCGFSSQAHFSDAFRRATAQTPLNFRRSRI